MDAVSQTFKEQILRHKCSKHKCMNCDILYMDPTENEHLICTICMKEKRISFEKVAFIGELLCLDQSSQIALYPLKMNYTLQKLINTEGDLENLKIKVKQQFSQLQEEVALIIGKAFENENEEIQKMIEKYHNYQSIMKRILSVQKIQEILLLQDEDQKAHLHNYIVEHNIQSKMCMINGEKILAEASRFCQIDENFDGYQQKIKNLISQISYINNECFNILPSQSQIIQKWDTGNLLFLPSKLYSYSCSMRIQNLEKQVLITNISHFDQESYVSNPLKQNSNYLIKLSTSNIHSEVVCFQFGVLHQQAKNVKSQEDDILFNQDHLFAEKIQGYYFLTRDKERGWGKNYQIQINIEQNIFIVYNYDQKGQINCLYQKKFDQTKQYVFAIFLSNKADQVKIHEAKEVDKFDLL